MSAPARAAAIRRLASSRVDPSDVAPMTDDEEFDPWLPAPGQIVRMKPRFKGSLRRTSSVVAVSGERPGEGLDVADMVVAGLVTELTHRHVLEHAAAKITDGLLAHRGLLS